MALTPDQYITEAENALTTAKTKAGGNLTNSPQFADAYAHIAAVYVDLYNATKV
jgi:hypothetical protein